MSTNNSSNADAHTTEAEVLGEDASSQRSAGSAGSISISGSSSAISGTQITAGAVNRNVIRPSRSQGRLQQPAGSSSARQSVTIATQPRVQLNAATTTRRTITNAVTRVTARPSSASVVTARLTKKPTAVEASKSIQSSSSTQQPQKVKQEPLHRQQYPPAVPPPGAITRCSRDVLSLILAQLNWTDFLSAIKINRQWNSLATLSTSWPQTNSDSSLNTMIARDCHLTMNQYGSRMDPNDDIAALNTRCVTIYFKKGKSMKSKLPIMVESTSATRLTSNVLSTSKVASSSSYKLSLPKSSSSSSTSSRMLQHVSSVFLDFLSLCELQHLDVSQVENAFTTIRGIMPNLIQIRLSLSAHLTGGTRRLNSSFMMISLSSTDMINFFIQQPQLQWIELDHSGSLFHESRIIGKLINELSLHLPQLRVLHIHIAYLSHIQPESISRFHALEYLKMDATDLQSGMFDAIRLLSINHQLKSLSLTSVPGDNDEISMREFRVRREFRVLFEDPVVTSLTVNNHRYQMVKSAYGPNLFIREDGEPGDVPPGNSSSSAMPYQPAALTRLHFNQAVDLPIKKILLNMPTLTDVHFESYGGSIPKDIIIPEWIKQFRVSGGSIKELGVRADKKSTLLSEYFTIRQHETATSPPGGPSSSSSSSFSSSISFSSRLEMFQISLRNFGFDCSSFRFSNSILNKFINDNLTSSLHSLTDLKLHEITIRDELTCLDRLVALSKLSLLIRPQAEMKYLIGPLSRLSAFHTLILYLSHEMPVLREEIDLPSKHVPPFQLDTKELIQAILTSSSWSTLRIHTSDRDLTSKQLMDQINVERGLVKPFIQLTSAIVAVSSSSSSSSSSSLSSAPFPHNVLPRLSSFRQYHTTSHPTHGGEIVYGLSVKMAAGGQSSSVASKAKSSSSSSSSSPSLKCEYVWRKLL